MVDVLPIAKSIVEPAIRLLLIDRRRRDERSRPLVELINVTLTDDYKRRKLNREIEAICDSVAQRLERLIEVEWPRLNEGDRSAAFDAAQRVLASADLSDHSVMAIDVDPSKLSQKIRGQFSTVPGTAGLGSQATALYERVLDEFCIIFAQLVVHLPSFAPRGIAELLNRSSKISELVEEVLSRIPVRSLEAPTGTDLDEEFLSRYLSSVGRSLDEVDLFGVDVHSFRPSATLTMAYISLTASIETLSKQHLSKKAMEQWRQHNADDRLLRVEASSLSVEHALSHSSRILIRGEAGAGKTTLLHWLAVNAARSSFGTYLQHWNGKTPFLISLRRHAGSGPPAPEGFLESMEFPISALMPEGWAHRELTKGALLLVDGVDELPANERRTVRVWIRRLLAEYPKGAIVVTSRPAAAAANWLATENFLTVRMDRMGPLQVKRLIKQWHNAISDAGNLPCDPAQLPQYERALTRQLEASPHLQGIATNPLLCALLCALNLDRRTALPRDRMGIYNAALEMLLERRDLERRVHSQTIQNLDLRAKVQILQYMAWRLSLNGRVELSREDAIRRISERLTGLPLIRDDPESILEYLVHRSGVIREPVINRIDFVHRTFQEYMTAREAAELGDVGLLVEKAHRDSWRETIIMAAGHANLPTRTELLNGILDRADSERRNSRKLRLLAASCLETLGPIDSTLRERIEDGFSSLFPPRSRAETQSLASAGPLLIRRAPLDLNSISPAATCAIIDALALVGGEAIDVLSRYAENSAEIVQDHLQEIIQYFDPAEYAARVLAPLSKSASPLWIRDMASLNAWRQVPNCPRIDYLMLEGVADLGEALCQGTPEIDRLWVSGRIVDLSPLTDFAGCLQELTVWSTRSLPNSGTIPMLPNLTRLTLGKSDFFDNIEFCYCAPHLEQLWLPNIEGARDFEPLLSLENLTELRLYDGTDRKVFAILAELSKLSHFGLVMLKFPGGLKGLASRLPSLRGLRLMNAQWVRDLEPLAAMESLELLDIDSDGVSDLAPLRNLQQLQVLDLDCPAAINLKPIASLPNLRQLYIRPRTSDLDLSMFRHRQISIYVSDPHLYSRWRGKLGRSARMTLFG